MVNIGSHPGLYETNPDSENISGFFEKATFESSISEGIMVSLPNGSKVYVPVSEIKNGRVLLKVTNHLVRSPNIKQVFAPQPVPRSSVFP
jgi:hypothetical protein